MDKELKKDVYLIALVILVSLFFFELVYKQKSFQSEIAFAEFDLVTSEMLSLGKANSSINVIYKPSRPSKLGQFVVVIGTKVDDAKPLGSIYSLDVNYEVVFLWRNRIIASWKDNYMGALSIKNKNALYCSRTFPSLTQPMLEVRSRWGLVNIKILGRYYNPISNQVLSMGETSMKIFILPPLAKIVTATLIFIILCLWYSLSL